MLTGRTSSSLLGPTLPKAHQAAVVPGAEILRLRPLLSLLLVWMLVCQTVVPASSRQAMAHGASTSSEGAQANDGGWLNRLVKAFTPAGAPLTATVPVEAAPDTLTDAVISRQHPNLNSGRIEGTLRVLAGQSFSISSNSQLTSDLYLVGTPTIQLSGTAQHGGVVNAGGAGTPANYTVTLANGVNMPGRIFTHADAAPLPADFPASVPAATGSRSVSVNSQSGIAAIGDWQTVRDLSVSGNGLTINVPPGNYGTFTVNGNSRLNFTAGAYNFANTFNLDGSASIQATGLVVVNVAQSLTLTSGALVLGSYTSPGDVRLNVLGTSLNINGSSQVTGLVRAYNGTAAVNGTAQVRGQVIANTVTLNGGKVIGAVWPARSGGSMSTFGPRRFDRTTGPPNQYLEQFSLPADVISPYTLHIQNGSLDGTNRVSSATVKLNGIQILSPSDLNQNVAGLDRTVTLNSINTLEVKLASVPGSYLIINIGGALPAGDTTPPTLAITSPANNATTTDAQITVSGTASDAGSGASGVAQVYVNGHEATYNPSDSTWTIANVPLSMGANAINVQAVDQAGNQATANINVTRGTPNQPPVVNAGADQTLALPSSATLHGSASDDGLPQGSNLVTAWTMVSGTGAATFADPSALDTSASFSLPGTYVLRLTADDSVLSNSDDVTITVEPPNQPPTVVAGPDQTIALPHAATLNGSATDDGLPTASILSVTWNQVSGPGTATFAEPTLAETTATFSEPGSYVLRLSASDSDLSSSSDLTVTVQPANQVPTVNAGPDQIIVLPAPALLNGSAADDGWPAGSSLTETWTVVSGPAAVNIANPNATVTMATFSLAGTYVLRLTASDGELSSSDDLSIIVDPQNQPPLVDAGPDHIITLPDQSSLNGVVSDDGWPRNSSVTVSWSQLSGPGTATFGSPDAASTNVSFNQPGTYTLRLSASDGALTASDDVAITVIPENHAPTANAGADQSIALPANANLNGSASDDGLPAGSTFTTTWSKLSGPGTVTFGNPNVTVTTAAFSEAGTYALRLTASDSELTTSDDVVVIVDPENQAPTVNAGADQTITLPAQASLNGNVTDDGWPRNSSVTSSWSQVSGPGTATFATPNTVATNVSFSEAGTYVLRLTASDSQLSSSDEVQVIVIPENQAPTVDARPDQTITLPNTANLNGSVGDDGLPAGSSVTTTWSKVSGPGVVTFTDPNVTVTTAAFSVAGNYLLRLTASDSQLSTSDDVALTVNQSQSPPLADFTVPGSGGLIQLTPASYSSFNDNSYGSFLPKQTLDFSPSTYWESAAGLTTNQFLTFRTSSGESILIDRLRLQNRDADSDTNIRDFELQVSNATENDADFVGALSATLLQQSGNPMQEFFFPGGPVAMRYVRLIAKNNYGSPYSISLGTFNPIAIGSADSIISLPGAYNAARDGSPALIANGGAIYSYSYAGGSNSPNAMLDYGQVGWVTSGVTGQYAVIQLAGAKVYTIDGVKLATWLDYGLATGVKDFEVWVSATTPDDSAFTRVLTATAELKVDVQSFLFPGGPVQARYVKYVPLTNFGGSQSPANTKSFDVIAEDVGRVVGFSSVHAGVGTGEGAFDGDLVTYWISAGGAVTNEWIKVALAGGSIRKIYGVRIYPYNTSGETSGPKDFEIRVSTTTADASAFSTVYSGTISATVFTPQEFLFNDFVDAKYVQFFWKNGYSPSYIVVRELEVLSVPEQGSALIAYSSADADYQTPNNALDIDSTNTAWFTANGQTTDQWMKLLLPKAQLWTIDHVALQPWVYSSSDITTAPKDFEIQVSTTDAADSSFSTVFSGTLQGAAGLQDFHFTPVQARYVKLLLRNNYGASRTGLHTFYVFTPNQGSVDARFVDGSTDADGRIVSWAWDFGDGGTSNEQSPLHHYAAAGTYTVTLTVTDDNGLTDSHQLIYTASAPLTADFAGSPVVPHEGGEEVRFTDTTQLLVQSNSLRVWNLGNGSPPLDSYSPTLHHTFPDSGTYNVTLTLGNDSGVKYVVTKQVQVLNMPPSVGLDPGKTVVWGEQWNSVPRISDQSSIDSQTLIGVWNFGDGQTSTCLNCNNTSGTITHSYSLPGAYDATLTVTDKDGGVGSASASYLVNKRPTAFVFQNPPAQSNGQPLVIQAQLMDTFANQPLSGKAVQITVNGASFNAVTGANGVAEVSVPLPAGTKIDIITGSFAEDEYYLTANGVAVPVTAGGTPPSGAPSHQGTDFWLMFPYAYYDGQGLAVQTLYITSPVATTGTVTIPGLNFTQNFNVQANTVLTMQLPYSQVHENNVITAKGIHVTAQQPVSVYGLNKRIFTSDALLGLPVNALGMDYYILTYSNMSFAPSSELGVVATENDTIVTITPSVTSSGHTGGVPFNITLNQGQTYLLQNTVPAVLGDVSGSHVTSNKPIAVFAGHMAATIPAEAGCCADHLVEQLPPTSAWGKRFATVPLATRTKGDFFRFIAAEDGTSVYLNGNLTAVLNRGQFVERILTTPTEIIATRPIMVAQYSTSIFYDSVTTSKADPFLMIIPPYSQFLNHYNITTPATGFEINYANVVAPTASLGSITLDGAAIPAAGFTPIGVSGFSGAQIPLSIGAHTLDGPASFGVFVYGYNQDEGYGYPGGMNMTATVASTNVAVSPETSSHSINTQGCVVATATDQDQNPLGGQTLNFTVTGANPANSSVVTDAAGQATLCYVGTSLGTDQIVAAVGSAQATASIVWTPPNQPPVVNAGADQTITLPAVANLQGSATDDALPVNTLTVSWAKVSGPGNVTFGDANAAATTAAFAAAGVYVLRLSASDTVQSSSDEVQITVNEPPVNQPPTAAAGPDQTVALHANLIANGGNEDLLAGGEIPGWTEVQGTTWTQGSANIASGFPEAQRGTAYFYSGNAAQAELRQDIDLSAYAANIAAGTQQFEFKAYVRSLAETAPDSARVILEYRDATNQSVIASLDSGDISSTSGWHLTEDARIAPVGAGWIRVRLIAARNSGAASDASNDAFFDSLSLRPVGAAAVRLNGVVTDDGLPYGSSLTASWNVVSGPGAVAFATPNAAVSGVSFTTAGTYVLRLTASDGEANTSDDVTVIVNPANQTPVVNAGANQTITLPATAGLNGTVTDDGQPPGSSVSVSWSKVSGPGVVTFANAASAATTASFSAAGTYVLRLAADDTEYDAAADITITVNPESTQVNQPPAVNPGANQTISLPADTVTLNGAATDDGRPAGSTLTVTWTQISGPGVVTFGNANNAVTTAQFSAVGSYVLRLSASDGAYLASADVGVILTPQNQSPTANAGADQTILLSQGAQLDGSAADDGLPAGSSLTTTWTVVSGPGTVTFGNPNVTITGATFSAIGTYVLRLTASDGALSASDDVTITVNDNVAPPTVEITAPADGSSVTEPAIVTGSVSGGAWQLEYSLASDDNTNNRIWTTFASGNGAVANGQLGTLDPTMMLNGLFTIRLSATDTYGQISRTSISVIVERNLKVGNFTVSFSDLNIPVAGVPMEVTRTYDTRDKRVGDFGFGWTLGLRNIRLEKSGVLGFKWYETVSQEVFPNYCLEATGSHVVTVTFPGGKVFKFQAAVTPQCQRFAPISGGTVSFTPMAGTHGTLEVVGSADFQVEGSIPGPVNLIGFGGGVDIFNSFVFKFTAEDGTAFVIDQRTGLQSVADTNNNTVTVNAGGIFHSSGKSIVFTRDSLGRISQITDPAGNVQTYTYDAAGDLVSYTDNENNTSTYAYDTTHRLLTIHDPRGIQPIRNEYDADGRLISHTDGFGKVITYTHNLPSRVETITDRLGHSTSFAYDERGNVLTKTDARGGVTEFTYDANDNVLTETNALGKTTTSTYDATDHRTSSTDPLGNTTQFTYNALGKMLTTTDPLGRVTTNTYNGAGNLLSTKDALNNTTSFVYSIFDGQQTSTTDALNNTTSYAYTGGYLTKETDALANESTFTYDSNGNRASQTVKRTNAQGQLETITTSNEYDKLNRLKKTIFADGSFTLTEYNAIGQQAATIDQLGRRTEFTYDDMGRLTRTDYPDSTHDETTYEAEGRRLTSKDRAGRVTSYTYDELGRLTKTTYPDNTFTSTTYDVAGQVLTSTDARGNVTTYIYDNAGRRTKVRNALNQETTFAYDAGGNQLSMTDALSRTTNYEYDANNRRVKTTYADSTFDTAGYDALGRSVSKTDQAGKSTQFTYDVLGRLLKVKDALNQETTYGYNEIGQQLSQTDANSHTTRFEYDQLGRRVKRILPAGQFETYGYDIGGNLQNRTDFNGKTSTFNYDVMRRLLSKVPDASLNQPAISFTYNTSGQRATMLDASGTTVYNYDVRNRLASKQTPFGTLSYTYNESGSLLTTRSSNANGVSVDYSYDSLNRLATVKDNNLAALNGGITTYSYDTVGNLQSYLYPNGVTTSYNYNTLNRLTSMNASAPVSTLASYTYTLGATGNRTGVTELSGRTVNYTYDDLYRLTSESIANDPHGINGTASYGYDPVGNRLNRSSSVAPVPSQTSTYDANDRLTSDSYDNNGNTTAANSNSYAYDFENHLTSLNGGNVTYVYDGDGNRVAKTVGGVTTNYLVDNNNTTSYAQVVDELQAGSAIKSFTYGHDLVSQRIVGGSLSFYGYDGHGSVRLLTDATAAVTDAYDYDAFGNLIYRSGTTPNDYLYSGEQFDANLGFYYLRARYMNPSSGRFWTQDSFEGNGSDPLSLHKYLYANANPENRIDPSGNFSLGELSSSLSIHSILSGIATMSLRGLIAGAIIGGADAGLRGDDILEGAIQGGLVGALLGPLGKIKFVGQALVVLGTSAAIVGVADAVQEDNYQLAAFRSLLVLAGAVTLVRPETPTFSVPPRQPPTGGRLGNESTRAQIREIAAILEDRGWEIIGGGKLREEYLPPMGGSGTKGSNFVDLTAMKNGRTLRINTIDTISDGVTPTLREGAAAALIRAKKPGDHLVLIPK